MNNYPFPGARLDDDQLALSASDGKTDVQSEPNVISLRSGSIQNTNKTYQ